MGKISIATALAVFLSLATLSTANAQSVAGQISGTVADSDGAVIPGASVEVTHDLSKQVRTFTTDQNGSFIFPGLLAGDYDIRIVMQGFKAYQSKGISVAAQENVDLHEIKLQIGDVSTSIEVRAEAARVQTTTSDRISTLSIDKLQSSPGRNFLAATRTIPGSQSTNSAGGGTINGGQTGQLVLQLDGIIQQDSGAPSANANAGRFNVNLDAVSEIQVQVNTMNAEFGSRAGGQILVTTKNGTSQFHGSVFYFLRNEALNANTFFLNKQSQPKQRYRYQQPGFTVGGPVLLPWLSFNRSRSKMFFFYSEEHLANKN